MRIGRRTCFSCLLEHRETALAAELAWFHTLVALLSSARVSFAPPMTEPSSNESIERAVHEALESLGARYEVMACDPALADTTAFCAHYGIDPGRSANAILIASRKEPKKYALCLVLATTKLDVNKKVAELIGVKKL